MTFCSLEELLSSLSWSSDAPKEALSPKVSGVAKSLAFDGSMIPGWFFTEDFDQVGYLKTFDPILSCLP